MNLRNMLTDHICVDITSIIWFCMILQCIPHEHTSFQQCNAIVHSDFENCRYSNSISNSHEYINLHSCKNTSICEKEFTISYVHLLPYYYWNETVKDMVNFCCGKCANLKTINIFSNFSQITMASLSSSDFVYPFLAAETTHKIHGFYFIPKIDAPSTYYVTRKKISQRETLLALVKSCADLWPFFAICLLLAIVFGFFVWSAESRNNYKQFSKNFYVGIFDGFWWAFVSMTTVGYGDKIPKSWAARAVSIVWILIGISMCSIFTAALTTNIIKKVTPVREEITGHRIGWLKHRFYEATIIAQYHGRPIGIVDGNYISGIHKLLIMLFKRELDGILLDKYLYNLFKINLRNKEGAWYDKTKADDFFEKTSVREVSSKAEMLSFGILVRNYEHYLYFRKYITDNKMQAKACNTLRLNSFKSKAKMNINIFSLEAGLFWPSFVVTLATLIGIVGFGLLFEMLRLQINCYMRIKRNREMKDEEWRVKGYTQTPYKQCWIDLCEKKDTVLGNKNAEEALTCSELEKELSKQSIYVIYLEKYDVLMFNEKT